MRAERDAWNGSAARGPVATGSDSRYVGRLAAISRGIGALTALASGAVVMGWAFDVDALKGIIPGFATMKVNTALSLGFAGAAIVLLAAPRGRLRRNVGLALGSVTALLAVLTIIEYATGVSLGIDELFVADLGSRAIGVPPGRMSPATAVGLTMLGLSVLTLDATPLRGWRLSRILAVATALVAGTSVAGYAYDAPSLYAFGPYASVALHTSVLLTAMGVAVVLARPEGGILAGVLEDTASSAAARRLLLWVSPLTFALGWLALLGIREGEYGTPVALGVMAVAAAAVSVWFVLMAFRPAHQAERAFRKAAEDAERRRADLEVTLQSIGDGVIATDSEARIVRLNPMATAITGWSEDDARGRTLTDVFRIFNETTREPVESPVDKVLREGCVVGLANHTVLVARDGHEVAIADSGAPIRDEGGDIRGVILVFRDVSAERTAEKERAAAERRFHALVENSGSVVGLVGADELIQYVAPSVQRVLGYGPEELVGKSPSTHVEPEHVSDALRGLRELKGNPGASVRSLYRMRHRDGSSRWMDVTATNLLSDPEVGGIVVNLRDVTEQRRTEQSMLQAQRMESLGQLVGGVAHDFNNLLAVILGLCEQSDPTRDAPQQVASDFAEIRSATLRAADLVRQLLAFGRRQMLSPRVLNLNDNVQATMAMLRRLLPQNIHVEMRLDPDLSRVFVDPAQFDQVVLNLVVNARDAMPDGGTLRLQTSMATVDDAYARERPGLAPGRYVSFTVSDSGIGMSEETKARVFEPFFTTKERGKGTGLGLSTVHGIVAQSGGDVSVQSEVGAGTSVRVLLPAHSAGTAAPVVAGDVDPHLAGTETVLVVEDNDSLRRLAARVLSAEGYVTLEAATAEDALRIFQERADVALVLSDVILTGLSGADLIARLRAIRPATRVILMSGYSDRQAAKFERLHPRVPYLQKPFQRVALLRAVRAALDAKEG